MTETVSLPPSVRRISSSTTVSPYPARTLSSSSARSATTASMVAFLTEINRPHLLVVHDLFRRALGKDSALHHHSDFFGKTKYHVHVMLDDQNGDVGVERSHH